LGTDHGKLFERVAFSRGYWLTNSTDVRARSILVGTRLYYQTGCCSVLHRWYLIRIQGKWGTAIRTLQRPKSKTVKWRHSLNQGNLCCRCFRCACESSWNRQKGWWSEQFQVCQIRKRSFQRQSLLDLGEWPATMPNSSEVTFLNKSWGPIWTEVGRHRNCRHWEQLASGAQEGWWLLPIRRRLPFDWLELADEPDIQTDPRIFGYHARERM